MKMLWNKPFFWSGLLSYVIDVPLEKASTPLNPSLALSLRKGRFYLTTPNAIYSYGDLYKSFFEAFLRIGIRQHNPKNVLILGFGMGSIPYMLERKFGIKCSYTGVEADDTIVKWAKRYLLPQLKSEVLLQCTDALEFAAHCKEKFDLIAVDVFLDDEIPEKFDTLQFTQHLQNLLEANGLIMWNRLIDTPVHRTDTDSFLSSIFKKVFSEAYKMPLDANCMLFNRK